jgi:hypothetical protein
MVYAVVWGYAIVGVGLNFQGARMTTYISAVVLTIGLSTLLQSWLGHRMAMVHGPNVIPSLAIVAAFTAAGEKRRSELKLNSRPTTTQSRRRLGVPRSVFVDCCDNASIRTKAVSRTEISCPVFLHRVLAGVEVGEQELQESRLLIVRWNESLHHPSMRS